MSAAQAAAALAIALLLPVAARAQPVDYALTPTHSFVHFEWDHAGLSTLRGRFDKVAGRVTLDRAAGQGRAEVTVRLDSINTGRPTLDAALRQAMATAVESPADAAEGRPLGLSVERMTLADGRVTAARARFTWRGQSRELALTPSRFNCYLNPLLRREVCGGDFDAELDPQALGIGLDPAFGLSGPIRLRVQLEAIRQEGDS